MTDSDMVRWHHQLNGLEFEIVKDRERKPEVLQSTGSQTVGHN